MGKPKITVQVKLFVTLRRYYPELGIGEAMPVELSQGAKVGDLVDRLRLPADLVTVVFVNGVVRDDDWPLNDGDELSMFPPVGGG